MKLRELVIFNQKILGAELPMSSRDMSSGWSQKTRPETCPGNVLRVVETCPGHACLQASPDEDICDICQDMSLNEDMSLLLSLCCSASAVSMASKHGK